MATHCVQVCGGVRGKTATVSTATALARGTACVWRVLVAAAKLVVQRGGPGEVCCGEATRGQGMSTGALGRVHAVIGTAWATLDACCLTCVGFLSGNGGHRGLQGSEVEPEDMVARAGEEGEKKRRNMAGMGVTWPCPWPASLSPRVSVME